MRWGTFFFTGCIVALIILFQWRKMIRLPKKDIWTFFLLLIFCCALSLFDLEDMAGPLKWTQTFFKPVGHLLEK